MVTVVNDGLSDDIVERARGGERAAIDAVLRAHYPFIRGMTLRLMGAKADTDDLQQTILIKIAHALPTFRGDASLHTWITTICVNVCRDSLRRTRTRRAVFDEHTEVGALLGPVEHGTPEHAAVTRERLGGVLAALDQLSVEHRLAFVLKHVYGHSVDEIAQITDSARSTTRMRLYYARKAFTRAMAARSLQTTEAP